MKDRDETFEERGVVVTHARRNYPASDFAAEDAMIEYYALLEKKDELRVR